MAQSALAFPSPKPRIDFRKVLNAINADGRITGSCSPTLCAYWNAASADERRIIEAVLAFEQVTGERARPENIDRIRAWRSKMDKDTADALARKFQSTPPHGGATQKDDAP